MEDKLIAIKNTNNEWIIRDIKAHIEKLIGEALVIDIDREGNYFVTDSSISMAVDDIHTYYDITERAE